MSKMKLGIISLGCAKNLIDSELILGLCTKYDLEIIIKHRKEENKLEFAFQLAALRYQGWSYSLNKEISLEIIRYIAKQVGTVPKALKLYALRSNTSRDHIES